MIAAGSRSVLCTIVHQVATLVTCCRGIYHGFMFVVGLGVRGRRPFAHHLPKRHQRPLGGGEGLLTPTTRYWLLLLMITPCPVNRVARVTDRASLAGIRRMPSSGAPSKISSTRRPILPNFSGNHSNDGHLPYLRQVSHVS